MFQGQFWTTEIVFYHVWSTDSFLLFLHACIFLISFPLSGQNKRKQETKAVREIERRQSCLPLIWTRIDVRPGSLSRKVKKGVHASTLKGQNKQFNKCPSYSWFRHIDFYKHLSWCPSHNLIAPLKQFFHFCYIRILSLLPLTLFSSIMTRLRNIYFLETSVEQWP